MNRQNLAIDQFKSPCGRYPASLAPGVGLGTCNAAT